MTFRLRQAVLAGCVSLALSGCANPNFIGVQDYGSIYGNAVSSTNAAISGAYVSATGTTSIVQTAPGGAFTLSNVAVGEQTLTIQAPGYATATATVVVTKDMPVNAGNIVLTQTTSTPITR
jgi:hypothetical protein